jgi:hypothetical protein
MSIHLKRLVTNKNKSEKYLQPINGGSETDYLCSYQLQVGFISIVGILAFLASVVQTVVGRLYMIPDYFDVCNKRVICK